jgi:hypothetical protein
MPSIYPTIIGTHLTSKVLSFINGIIALSIFGFVYLVELYCIYLDRHHQQPNSNVKKEYTKYYGNIRGTAIYGLHTFGEFLTRNMSYKNDQSDNYIIKFINLPVIRYLWKLIISTMMLITMFFKNIVFKVIFNKMALTTFFAIILYLYYRSYIVYNIEIFNGKHPDMLLNLFSSTIYKTDTSNTPSYTFIDKQEVTRDYTLKDYYINAVKTPYIIGDDRSIPTTKSLQYVVNAGARYMTFDIYEDIISTGNIGEKDYDSQYIPNVRNPYMYNKDDGDLSRSRGIPFDEMMKALANTKPFSQNPDYPLILHLNFWNQDDKNIIRPGFTYKATYNTIYITLTTYFKDKLGLKGSNYHGYGGLSNVEGSFSNIKMSECRGRLLLVSNVNPQNNQLMANISKYLNGTINMPIPPKFIDKTLKVGLNPDPTFLPHSYTQDLYNSGGISAGKDGTTLTDFIDFNKKGIRLVIPDDCIDPTLTRKILLRQNTYNPHILDCMNTGCQIVLMNFQYMNIDLQNNQQIFDKTSFILKPDILRDDPPKPCTKAIQSTAVSFAPKSVVLKGIQDDAITF